ncbi:hypothetical protein WJ973_12315 [Achromobacter xylosoxidans]
MQWNGRQAVLFDLGAVFTRLVLQFQDVVYLRAAGDLGAGAVPVHRGGRPVVLRLRLAQTVYTRSSCGSSARSRRPRRPHPPGRVASTWRKARSKATKHFLWIALAWWTGLTFIGYFAPIRELGHEPSPRCSLGRGNGSGMQSPRLAFVTWGNAGFARVGVQIHVPVRAPLQAVMVEHRHLRGDLRYAAAATTAWRMLGKVGLKAEKAGDRRRSLGQGCA